MAYVLMLYVIVIKQELKAKINSQKTSQMHRDDVIFQCKRVALNVYHVTLYHSTVAMSIGA